MKDIVIDLPETLGLGETPLNDGRILLYGENASQRWGWIYVGDLTGTIRFTIAGIPGTAPATANFSEWSIKAKVPFIGDTYFYVNGVAHARRSINGRDRDCVTIICSHSSTNSRQCAIGFAVPKQ